LKRRDHLEDLDLDERVILEGILKTECKSKVHGSYEQGNEPLVSIKGGEFLDYLAFSRRTLLFGVTLLVSLLVS
jgi:hypothetical protein